MDAFYAISRTVLVSLADVSIRSLLLATVAMLFLWIVRVRRADVKHAVYSLVLIAMMAMPAAERLAPALAIRVLRPLAAPLLASSLLPPASNSKLTRGVRNANAAEDHPIWLMVVAGIYGTGLLMMIARLMRSYAAIRRLCRTARPLGGDAYASDAVVVPMTVGWLHPKILLPAQSGDWDPDTRRAVLAHERAHIERMDWLAAMASSVNR